MVLAVLGAVAMAGAAPRNPAAQPDADFLEFLGSWHAEDDRWVDPFQVGEPPGTKDGERNQDVRSGDNRDRENLWPNPRNESNQQGSASTLPRRDVNP